LANGRQRRFDCGETRKNLLSPHSPVYGLEFRWRSGSASSFGEDLNNIVTSFAWPTGITIKTIPSIFGLLVALRMSGRDRIGSRGSRKFNRPVVGMENWRGCLMLFVFYNTCIVYLAREYQNWVPRGCVSMLTDNLDGLVIILSYSGGRFIWR
jgi:hypothetical protein